jgi:halogenation protein CepH
VRRRLRLRPPQLSAKESRFEVVVLGGGPAGCAAASILARRSHRVALVRPERSPAGDLAESVPPSSHSILTELGFLDAIRAGRFHPNRGNTVWWAGDDARVESFPEDRTGLHTDRTRLESVLSEAVERVGAHVVRGAARAAREEEEDPDGHPWHIRCTLDDGAERELRARWVVDATGRHGLLARAEGRQPDRSTTTLALVRRWRRADRWPTAEPGHTLVESYDDGWAWSVPLSPETRCFTAMIDQRRVDFEGDDLDGVLGRELARTRHLASLLEGAEPVGKAWACPASLYTAARFARPGLVLVGDAGSFIDPLSSFGVKKALSSGWLGGIVVHTALTDPAMTGPSVDFFDARERAVYRSYRAASVDFFDQAAGHHGTGYWIDRASAAKRAARAASGPTPDFGDPLEPPVPADRVRAAFDRIRSLDRLHAEPGTTLRTLSRPGIEGDRLAMREHLATDAVPGGVRFVRGVDLAALVDVAPRHEQVPDAWSAYNGVAPPVTLPDYLTALSTAFAAGLLRHAGESD